MSNLSNEWNVDNPDLHAPVPAREPWVATRFPAMPSNRYQASLGTPRILQFPIPAGALPTPAPVPLPHVAMIDNTVAHGPSVVVAPHTVLMPQVGNHLNGGELSALFGQMNAVVSQNQVLVKEIQNLNSKVSLLENNANALQQGQVLNRLVES